MAEKQVQPGQVWKVNIPVEIKHYYIFVTKIFSETNKFYYYQLDDPKQLSWMGDMNHVINSKDCELVSG